MDIITSAQIAQKLNSLPETLLYEVDKYIDYLSYKYSDWSDALTQHQVELIKKGKADVEQNNTMTHQEAKEKIQAYIKVRSI